MNEILTKKYYADNFKPDDLQAILRRFKKDFIEIKTVQDVESYNLFGKNVGWLPWGWSGWVEVEFNSERMEELKKGKGDFRILASEAAKCIAKELKV
jgi:hypothetical protein